MYLIGGPMGVGKTTVCRCLQRELPKSVFLDGDWCWDAHPFQVTEETKSMVLENICFVLNSFLRCSAYETVIFCWVMHRQSILDAILSRLEIGDCALRCVSLVADEAALRSRLERDVAAGLREGDVVERSLARLPLYAALNTEKLDTTGKTPQETARELLRLPDLC